MVNGRGRIWRDQCPRQITTSFICEARSFVMATATYTELLRRNRNFRRLWIGQMISELGSWFSFIAELGLVRLYSGSAMATTALLVARLLPFLLVAPLAGVFVDRRSRKQIMIAADLLGPWSLLSLSWRPGSDRRGLSLPPAF
jgi:hypothetical protein